MLKIMCQTIGDANRAQKYKKGIMGGHYLRPSFFLFILATAFL